MRRAGRRAAAGLALRPPASRRDDGRMVDGGRARPADRPRRRRSPSALRSRARFHIVPNMNPDGSRARAPADQRRRGQPQPRMGRADASTARPRSSMRSPRWTRPASISRWTSTATNRCRTISSPGSRASRTSPTGSLALLADYKTILARAQPRLPDARRLSAVGPGQGQPDDEHQPARQPLRLPRDDARDAVQGRRREPRSRAGWSPERSMALGRDCLAALLEVIDRLR